VCPLLRDWNTGFIEHDVVNEVAGTLRFGFSDVCDPNNFGARVVRLTSKIKVVDDITRAPKGLVSQITLDNALYHHYP
jgi:hypothetical protein